MRQNVFILCIVISVIAAILAGLALSARFLPPPDSPFPPLPPPNAAETANLVAIKTIISFVNLALILPLLKIYIDTYRSVRSRFTMGLIVMVLVLLIYALSSNPIVHYVFGFYESGLGPFTIIPDLFTTFALIILLYLSSE